MSSTYNSIIDYLREKDSWDEGSLELDDLKATFITNHAEGQFEIDGYYYYGDASCKVVYINLNDRSRRCQYVYSLEEFKRFFSDCCSSYYY